MTAEKVVLAYSGGLDTSYCVPALLANTGDTFDQSLA